MSSVIKRAAVSFVVCVGMSSAAFAGWTSSSGGNVPEQSVVAGSESDGAPLFVCRANYNGGVHPGKVRKAFGGCNIGWGGGEHKVSQYEVYTSTQSYGWVSASGGSIPAGAVIAGKESNGDPLFVCRAKYNGGTHPGKIRNAFGGCNIGWGGEEHKVISYEVLTE